MCLKIERIFFTLILVMSFSKHISAIPLGEIGNRKIVTNPSPEEFMQFLSLFKDIVDNNEVGKRDKREETAATKVEETVSTAEETSTASVAGSSEAGSTTAAVAGGVSTTMDEETAATQTLLGETVTHEISELPTLVPAQRAYEITQLPGTGEAIDTAFRAADEKDSAHTPLASYIVIITGFLFALCSFTIV